LPAPVRGPPRTRFAADPWESRVPAPCEHH